jgi:aminoglycoside 6'-N-acetyltransferase I
LQEPLAVLVAEPLIRFDLPGLQGKPVGYVEGLYVIPEARWRGVALKLLRAARHWSAERRCAAFASDRADRLERRRRRSRFR